jgi:N-acetylmuramic acid 6-phosphate etherase
MAVARTEQAHESARGLDLLEPRAMLRVLAEAQVEAARSVDGAVDALAAAAAIGARCLEHGGRIAYAAAGSSGLMALADALELPGTFGIAGDRVVVLLAGGRESLADLAGGPEDDAGQGARDVAAAGLGQGDCLVALSASGSTPYALGALEEAKRRGIETIGIANNPGAPLVGRADVGVVLATPPEVIAGSTRMGAGTAQKIALNMLSTLIAVHLGHVHDGYMVNLRADNIKLRDRAARIVAAIGGAADASARQMLEQAGGSVKTAILLAAGAADAAAAERLLDSTDGRLRPALSMLDEGSARSRRNGT